MQKVQGLTAPVAEMCMASPLRLFGSDKGARPSIQSSFRLDLIA